MQDSTLSRALTEIPLLAVLGATVALIAGSTLYAARRAAATRPVEALRT